MRRLEIEAYSNQAVAEEAYYGVIAEDNPYNWTSMVIESIRRALNSKHGDPYKVTKRFMSILDRHDIQIEARELY